MQPNDKNNGIGTVAVGYNHPPRIFRRPGEQGVIPGHYEDGGIENKPDLPVPISVMLHNADKALCPGPKPRPKPPKPAPVPCNCPPRTYRNPPDVIIEAGDNINVVATETPDVTTYTISANLVPAVPVKVDPETMYGDGVDEPIGVYEYEGDTPGLVPEAPAGSKEQKFLQADGTWVFVDFPVDQALDPASPNAVANGAVCGGLSALDEKIDELDDHIQPIPVEEIHEVVDPEMPEEYLDFDNEDGNG